jgi:predicted amidohydrolase
LKPREQLTVTAWTADLDGSWPTPEAFAAAVTRHVLTSWEEGADIVLMPEFLWLGLAPFASGLVEISALFWGNLWPTLKTALSLPDKCVVLGTVPFCSAHGMQNRAVILSDGTPHFQDKLCLTPWESEFQPGKGIHPWDFHGWRLATLVCLDIEIPEHSIALREEGIDLLLVPSATETILGTERIARCASARAVERGCYVIVSHLVGKGASELVDENIGRLSCYTPSQSAFRKLERMDEGPILTSGWHTRTWQLSAISLRQMRRNRVEANPALLP